MPIFEVEDKGVTYEVEAATAEEAASTFDAPEAKSFMDQALTGRNAPEEIAMREAQRKGAADIFGSGIPEGLQRLKAGVKQAGAGIYDYFTRLDKAGRGALDKVTAEELIRAQTADEEDRAAGVELPLRNVGAGATQAATLALGPEMIGPRATTFLSGLVANTARGGLGAALEFDPGDKETGETGKLVDTSIGAGVGAVTSVFGLPAALKNVVGRGLRRIALEGRTANRAANASRTLKNTTFSLAQKTGVPELNTLERAAYDMDQVNFYADQTDQFVADFAEALRQPIKPSQTLSGDLRAVKEVMDDKLGQIKRNASQAYEYGLSKAVLTARPDTVVPIQNLRNELPAIIEEAKSYARVREPAPFKESYIEHLETLLDPAKRGLTVAELSRTLKEVTALQSSSDPIAKALGTRLRNQGLEKDLDAVAEARGNNTLTEKIDDGVSVLLQTRAEYRRSMQLANELSEAGLFKMLDGAEDATSAIQKLRSFSPTKQAEVRDYMKKHAPQVLLSLKQEVVDHAVRSAGVIREAADSQQSLDSLQKALFDPAEGMGVRLHGIFSSQELSKLEDIKDGMRVIANNRPTLGGAGTRILPEDISINLVSRHSAFLAKQMTRVLMSSKASQFFIDPEIHKLMAKMNRSTTGSAANLTSRAALLAYLQDAYPEEEQQPEQ